MFLLLDDPKNTSDISPESLTHQKIHGDVTSGQRAGTMRAERQEGEPPTDCASL